MKVYLKLFTFLVEKLSATFKSQYPQGLRAGSPVELELPERCSVGNLLERLELGNRGGLLIFVNGRSRTYDYILSEGDQVGIFPPSGGG